MAREKTHIEALDALPDCVSTDMYVYMYTHVYVNL
jgi:hypothetical protein